MDSINVSMETINNLISDSIRLIRDHRQRPDVPTIVENIYRNEENRDINESTIKDRIVYLTSKNVLENKQTNNKDSFYINYNSKSHTSI